MERDSRRDRGQWKGCHAFEDATSAGQGDISQSVRGLKMGQTYYYYVC
jgi:hypothetical protein